MRKPILFAVSGLALITVLLILRLPVPLYDGVNFPDEPYRYVSGTPGKTNALKPTTATVTSDMGHGRNLYVINLYTGEQGSQLYVSLGTGTLTSQTSAKLVTLQAVPLIPNGGPSDLKIASNEYHVTATTDTGDSVSFRQLPTTPTFVDMRLPQGYPPGATIAYRANQSSSWRKLPTTKVGNDIYEADVVGFGNYAVSPGGVGAARASNKWLVAVPVAVVVVIVGLILRIKRHSKRGDH